MKRTAEAVFLAIALACATFPAMAATEAPKSPAKAPAVDPWAALKIRKETVATLPGIDPAAVVGIRTFAKTAVLMYRDGRESRTDLITGKTTPATAIETAGKTVLDFALNGGKIVALTSDGTLIGAKPVDWPAGPFAACRIDIANGEGFLSGGTRSFYLAPRATDSVVIPGNYLSMPLRDGFLWSMTRPGLRAWEASLIDGFGNQMKKIFKFSPEFDPTGVSLGPTGPEGELLVSYFVGASREVALVGQNGRMLWKLPVSAPVCSRDLAWDAGGALLVLEREGNDLVLKRIAFEVPQG